MAFLDEEREREQKVRGSDGDEEESKRFLSLSLSLRNRSRGRPSTRTHSLTRVTKAKPLVMFHPSTRRRVASGGRGDREQGADDVREGDTMADERASERELGGHAAAAAAAATLSLDLLFQQASRPPTLTSQENIVSASAVRREKPKQEDQKPMVGS